MTQEAINVIAEGLAEVMQSHLPFPLDDGLVLCICDMTLTFDGPVFHRQHVAAQQVAWLNSLPPEQRAAAVGLEQIAGHGHDQGSERYHDVQVCHSSCVNFERIALFAAPPETEEADR